VKIKLDHFTHVGNTIGHHFIYNGIVYKMGRVLWSDNSAVGVECYVAEDNYRSTAINIVNHMVRLVQII
jgi:hypothetical protein